MKKKHRVLAINPGSTSTKIALYEESHCLFEEVIRHSKEELVSFADIYAQYDYRRDLVEQAVERHGFKLARAKFIFTNFHHTHSGRQGSGLKAD